MRTVAWVAVLVAIGCAAARGAERGEAILETAGVTGGLVVHLDCGDGSLTAGLGAGDRFLVRGLDTDPAKVAAARKQLEAKGLYGRVSVGLYDGRSLPFVDNLATLVVAERASVPMPEILRVLHPEGVALVAGKKTVKPRPGTIDDWTHYLRAADNNAVAHDSLVAPPLHMQFLAAPLWARHHDRLASVSSVVTAKGRLFYIHDRAPIFDADEPGQWFVTARNAFNGVFLWQRPIESWTSSMRKFRSGPVQLQRLLVTDGDRVFAPLGLDKPISVLDADTGKVLRVLEETAQVEEIVLDGGVLFAQVGEGGAEHALLEQKAAGDAYKTSKVVKAVRVDTGKLLWRWPSAKTVGIMARTLTVSDGKVFFQESGSTVCLDAAEGTEVWRNDQFANPGEAKPEPEPAAKGKKAKKGRTGKAGAGRSMGWTYATLVAQDGVVLSCDGKTLLALDAGKGTLLWQCPASTPFSRTPSVDILVVGDRVWLSPGLNEGRNLKTGKVEQSDNLKEELLTAGHHHRCYRNKATDRYVIHGWRGLEFRDTQGERSVRHNWIRGGCQYGIMPANGMVYLPTHNCGCYSEAKLFGFWAVKAEESSIDLAALRPGAAVEKGPAYGVGKGAPAAGGADWPMHRHDPLRSGVAPAPVTAKAPAWTAKLDRRLSAPVVAGGTLLVAAIDAHQVLALDAKTGETQWTFTAGGPVDSPPTVHGDAVLFGSADGHAYCLRLSDGALAWRFRAAPLATQTVSVRQVESLWPVHGSILVEDGTAYFTAGRSTYLDGGIFLYGLDPATGAVKHTGRLHIPPAMAMKDTAGIKTERVGQNATDFKTAKGPDRSDGFSMHGNLSDILVAQDGFLYLRHQKLDRQLKPVDAWTHHLFSTSTLLDENESYRSHLFYGKGDFSRIPVAYEWLTRGSFGGFASPLGKFLVYDRERLWGAGWKKLVLFTTDIRGINDRIAKDFPKAPDKIEHKPLAASLPIHPRAMIKAGPALWLAGYPAAAGTQHLYGEPIQDKGLLIQVDAASGKILSQTELPASPRFDGMAAAEGRLYMTLENGSVMSLK